jgi:hypothetical protein
MMRSSAHYKTLRQINCDTANRPRIKSVERNYWTKLKADAKKNELHDSIH